MQSIASGRPASMRPPVVALGTFLACLLLAPPAHASLFEGKTLDTVANVIAWIAIIIVPVVLLGAFWWVHIMPEKIAEERHHPQLPAIKVLCLLSLVFGGMLWPIAWIWAYSKPVLYQLAYGRDKEVEDPGGAVSLHAAPLEPVETPPAAAAAIVSEAEDVAALKQRVASLEMQLAAASAQAAGRARGAETGGA